MHSTHMPGHEAGAWSQHPSAKVEHPSFATCMLAATTNYGIFGHAICALSTGIPQAALRLYTCAMYGGEAKGSVTMLT